MNDPIDETMTISGEPVWDIFNQQGEQDSGTYYGNAEIEGGYFEFLAPHQPPSYTHDTAPEHPTTIDQPVSDELSVEHGTNFMFNTILPPSQPHSSLAISQIYSIESAPHCQTAPSMAISDVLVVFQQVPRPSVETKEPFSIGPTKPRNIESELMDPTSRSSKSSLDADVNTTTLPVDIHDTTNSTLKNDRQGNDCPTRKSKSSSPNPRVSKTTQDSSRKFSRRIDFEELVVEAAARKKRKLSNEAGADDPMDTQENLKPPVLSESVNSTNDIPSVEPSSPKAVLASLEEDTNYPQGVSSPAQPLSVRKSSYKANIFQRGGTVAKPIIIEELPDKDDEETTQQDLVKNLDLMHYAFKRVNEQATTEDHEQTRLNKRPSSGHRQSSRHAHSPRSHSGLFHWKPIVDKMLQETEDLWYDVQLRWISVWGNESRDRGPFMTGFHDRFCQAVEAFAEKGLCTSDVHALSDRWKSVEGVIFNKLEDKEDRKLLNSFTESLRKFSEASAVLSDEDTIMDAGMEGDDEDDHNWTPSVG